MTTLVWMLSWLPLVLPAMSELPMPVNVTLTTSNFSHILKWEPGPGTPSGAYYHVSIATERETSCMPVAGCERVQQPLVCNLTEAFSDPLKTYITTVKAHNSSQSAIILGYKPIKMNSKRTQGELKAGLYNGLLHIINSAVHLGLPLLTVKSCGSDLCVDLKPPKEQLQEAFDSLSYQFQIRSNNGNGAQFLKDTRSLKRVILKDLAPGRQYCVSVRFSDELEAKESNFSQPVCAVTPGIFSADPLISAFFCLLVIAGVVVVALLVGTGFICLKRRPLPSVLASIHHMENALVVPLSTPLSSLLKIWPTVPSAGEKRRRLSLSDESEEESATKSTGGSTAGGYKLRPGANLSSSSSSSSLSDPLSPKPEPPSSLSSKEPLVFFHSPLRGQIPTETHSIAGLKNSLIKGIDSLTIEETKADKMEYKIREGDSQDVNLLTLTFGQHEEDKEEEENSHNNMPKEEVECHSSSEECSSTSLLLSQTSGSKEVVTETVSWCVDEEEEVEELDKYSGYMGRTCTNV